MPVYEYQCRKCGTINTFIEKVDEIKFFSRKCSNCKSRRLKKVLSSFSTNKNESAREMISDLKRYGNVNFVPQVPGQGGIQGPPPGGCPYAGKKQGETD